MKRFAFALNNGVYRACMVLVAAISLTAVNQPSIIFALPQSQRDVFENGVFYYDYNQSLVCSAVGVPADANAGSNTTYSGKPIIDEAVFVKVAENKATYEQAAQQEGIPWQLLAAIHYMENKLGRENPGANVEGFYDGAYQFRTGPYAGDATGGKYPPGPISNEEFLQQSINAAKFLKSKAAENQPANRELTVNASPDAVKDTLFGYNGRAGYYFDQAVRLGYTREQGYEGSVYVMNLADEARDSSKNSEWKTFTGSTASDTTPGSFLIYSALAGISIDNNCSNAVNGTVRQKVVALAKQELDLWTSGQLKRGSDYEKYTYGVDANWCAYFASWIYNQAGYPIDEDTQDGRVGAKDQIWDIGREGGRFSYHDVNSGYIPKPGDLVIQDKGVSHVNIVTAVSGDKITVIGGNQGGSAPANTYYLRSAVTQYDMSIHDQHNNGFVSPKD